MILSAAMKVAFVGKGGSGKTTISSIFARYLASQGSSVLAIDADINQHLGVSLGMDSSDAAAIPPMGLQIDKIKEYLRGDNHRISSNEAMAKTTPPGPGSRLVTISEQNPIYDHFAREIDGIRLLAVGPFSEDDLGVKCYHSKTGAAELLMSHMIDGADEYAIMDMTAGADSFASGMFTKFDVTFLVVEPTVKSISVYKQYKQYAKDHDVLIRVIGNKVEDASDVEFLEQHVDGDMVGWFNRSNFVRSMEKGQHLPFSDLEPDNQKALMQMKALVDSCQKDWDKFYRQTVEFHIRNAKSWANEAAGEDLTKQVDPDFKLSPKLIQV